MKVIEKNKTQTSFLTPLYRHVFYGRFSAVVVLLLLVSILLQPIDRAYANETDATSTPPAPIDTTAAITAPTESPPAIDATPPAVTAAMSEIPSVTTDTLDVKNTPESALASVFSVSTVDSTTTKNDTSQDSTTTTLLAEPASNTTTTTPSEATSASDAILPVPAVLESTTLSGDTSSGVDSASTSTPNNATSSTDSGVASSTASSSGSTFTVTTIPTSDSEIQFDKNDCVVVSGGSYYCHTKQAATTTIVKDGLYSQPDVDGDLEIFFAKNGVLEQITHNTVDDASPYYDSISNTIVWHRLIDDRYQIISYDVKTGAESQLTSDNVNNMEPTRAGKYTVWQHWNKDNWDIMLYDGSTVKLLTDTPQQDIAPTIRGNLVMWNRLTSDKKQTIELYDLTSGEYTTINDTEGGALSNPRMVLVYDAQFENGDVVTKGYDVATGKITPLSSVPASLPDKIPPPDKTGETRALIQSKSTGREDTELIAAPKPTIDPPQPGTGTSTATSTDTATINMQQSFATSTPVLSATTTDLTLDLSATTSLQITQSDVVVPSFTLASSTE